MDFAMTGARSDYFVWVDIETTGPDPRRDKIVEIGLAVTTVELELLGKWVSLVYPPDLESMILSDEFRETHASQEWKTPSREKDVPRPP